MTGEILGGAVHDHIDAHRRRLLVNTASVGVVGHRRDPSATTLSRDRAEVLHPEDQAARRFEVHQRRFGADRRQRFLGVEAGNVGDAHAKSVQVVVHEPLAGAVAEIDSHDVATMLDARHDRRRDCGHAAAEDLSLVRSLKCGQFLLNDGQRWVAESAIGESGAIGLSVAIQKDVKVIEHEERVLKDGWADRSAMLNFFADVLDEGAIAPRLVHARSDTSNGADCAAPDR